MKSVLNILRLSAGVMEGRPYANCITLDESMNDLITPERIDVGQQHAKVQLDTSDNNRLATLLANSGLVPGLVECELKTSVKSGAVSVTVIGFSDKKI